MYTVSVYNYATRFEKSKKNPKNVHMMREYRIYVKGKRSFGRKYGEEIKIKKNKLKFLYFQPHKRLFGSEERELNGGEWSVFLT